MTVRDNTHVVQSMSVALPQLLKMCDMIAVRVSQNSIIQRNGQKMRVFITETTSLLGSCLLDHVQVSHVHPNG